MTLRQSSLDPNDAVHDEVQLPGEPWTRVITKGQRLRIVDLEGTQAVDTLCYDAHDYENRYSAANTIRAQGNLFLSTGSTLLSVDGDALATIVADTCGRHDTVGGDGLVGATTNRPLGATS